MNGLRVIWLPKIGPFSRDQLKGGVGSIFVHLASSCFTIFHYFKLSDNSKLINSAS